MAIGAHALKAFAGEDKFLLGMLLMTVNNVVLYDYGDYYAYGTVIDREGKQHHTEVEFGDDEWDSIDDYSCSCSLYQRTHAMCEHIVATFLQANKLDEELSTRFPSARDGLESGESLQELDEFFEPEDTSDRLAGHLITSYAQSVYNKSLKPAEADQELARIECTLCYDQPYYSSLSSSKYLSLKIGSKKLYVVKNMYAFIEALKNEDILEVTKKYALRMSFDSFYPEYHPLLEFLIRSYNPLFENSYRSSAKKAFYLNEKSLDDFLTVMGESDIEFQTDGDIENWGKVRVKLQNPSIDLFLERSGSGFDLVLEPLDTVLEGLDHLYVYEDSQLYQATREYTLACKELLTDLTIYGSAHFASEDVPALFSSVIPTVRPYLNVAIDESAEKYVPDPLEINVYLDVSGEGVTAHMTFTYGDDTFDAFQEKYATQSLDIAREAQAESLISGYMGNILCSQGTLIQDDEASIYELLTHGISELQAIAEVHISGSLKSIRINPPAKVSVGVKIEGDLLHIDMDFEGLDYQELAEVLESYQSTKRYHRLRDGSFLPLEDDALAHIVELSETLALTQEDIERGTFSIEKNKALYLDAMLKKNEQLRYARDASFKEIIRKIQNVENSDFLVPERLREIMRNYQITGYRWLRTLHQLGFGGILADDMGLGKTLQALSLLQSLKDEGELGTSIVVCPASLVYNWKKEAEMFAPSLKVCTIVGSAAKRASIIETVADYDLVITSYDLVKRDIQKFDQQDFNYVILDEAQYIKNQATQSAKAVKLLKCNHRLALTGTPIENNLSELWSVFDFLMPGYLYKYAQFKRLFETPIAKKKDLKATEQLRALVRPFIMRRVKSDVLKELPEKIEQVRLAELGEKQQKAYLATLAQSKKELREKLNEAQPGQNRIHILAALTRLRQICCDPNLVFDNYDGESAKLSMCMDLINDCMQSGHRMLLFSQFTSMLGIIKRELEKAKIEYYVLDGSTPKLKRLEMVDQFNEGDVPIFLISLKAGGTGLNLTGADIVIHYDPWWNLSAQNQATDRTHRIGQTNQVQVFKLITDNTIEERILELQEAKAALADSIIQSGGNVFDALSSEELVALFEELK